MGSQQSQFEQRFHEVYSFIQLIDDPFFQHVKIYRKTKYNYNYMMVIERELSTLPHSSSSHRQPIEERIELIRNFQNNFTTKIEHYRMLTGKKLDCEVPMVRLYAEYQNHTLHDYLSALRGKGISISLDQILYVLRSISSGILTLRKMRIQQFEVSPGNVFLSIEGNVRLNPTYLLCRSFTISNSQKIMSSFNHDYRKYSLTRGVIEGNSRRETSAEITRRESKQYRMREKHSNSPSKFRQQNRRQLSRSKQPSYAGNNLNLIHRQEIQEQICEGEHLRNIRAIFLQLTRYLSMQALSQSGHIHSIIERVQSVGELLSKLPVPKCEELLVEQFISPTTQSSGQLFAVNPN